MKRHYLLIYIQILFICGINAQSNVVTGRLYDDELRGLASGTVVLLNPTDSTLEYFGITDKSGAFLIKNIKAGDYLLQASFIGFKSLFSKLEIPRSGGGGSKTIGLGDIVLQPLPANLEEVQVVAERVPLRIKGDTIEFDASAFKTHPDDVTEDLIKKLPGIEVDRAGNIKALGENVRKVYVDGKEFFGSDPTVATRNLPADAIDKIQVYDKKSDATEFTGIDDGTRDKTINLKLKEDKKSGVFGSVQAGYGTDGRYKGNAKAYKFTDRLQVAALGMINNVNQYGFSFNDYLDFNGGMGGLMSGGASEIKIESSDALPINFGQPIDGLTTSGAGGLNFSVSRDKNNRIFASYLVNGSMKDLSRISNTDYFTESGEYSTYDSLASVNSGLSHGVNFGFRRRIDSMQNLIVNGDVGLTNSSGSGTQLMTNILSDEMMSTLSSSDKDLSERLSGNVRASYIYKFKNSSVFKLNALGGMRQKVDASEIYNTTNYFLPAAQVVDNQFRDRESDLLYYSGRASYTFKLKWGVFLTTNVELNDSQETLDQQQGHAGNGQTPIDSLSPNFSKRYLRYLPGLNFQWNTEKSQLLLGLKAEVGSVQTSMNVEALPDMKISVLRPRLSWDYSPRTGRKLSFGYNTVVVTPEITQLLPTVNALNPLVIYSGNPNLEAEYSHRINGHWLLFDQFSQSSLMAGMDASYTQNKINWATTISDSLVQYKHLINVDSDYSIRGNIDFSTPIRKLGIKLNLEAEEGWNRGLSVVNGLESAYSTFVQDYSFSIDNRKKKKVDVSSGVNARITHTRYDVQSDLDKNYFDMSWYFDFDYSPNDKWNVEFSADIRNYADREFQEALLVPLLRAELNYYFLKNNRGTLSLSGFDLLNKNQIVMRESELNYLRETRSNTISRYFLLSFKYRLNSAAREGGFEIEMKRR